MNGLVIAAQMLFWAFTMVSFVLWWRAITRLTKAQKKLAKQRSPQPKPLKPLLLQRLQKQLLLLLPRKAQQHQPLQQHLAQQHAALLPNMILI